MRLFDAFGGSKGAMNLVRIGVIEELMKECWSTDPKDRPSSKSVVERLRAMTTGVPLVRKCVNVSCADECGTMESSQVPEQISYIDKEANNLDPKAVDGR